MSEYDKLMKELKDPKTQETMNQIVDEMIKKEKVKRDKIAIMMSGIEYIDWLINFTKDKEGFYDSAWDYSEEKLSESDQEKVYDLSLFFEGIYCYAKENRIYSKDGRLGEYFQIRIGDIGFEIGYRSGQGTDFYCKRVSPEDNFIDFIDILFNKKQDNLEFIEEGLNNLSNMISYLYNNGIPMEAIIETVNKTTRSIEREKKLLKKI